LTVSISRFRWSLFAIRCSQDKSVANGEPRKAKSVFDSVPRVDLRVGTSGWNYPSGRGTWNGIFYPNPEDRERGFDELSFYAGRFKTVEVNSTFYGQPRAAASLGWVKRTPAHFDFTVKLYQKFTHPLIAYDQGAITREDLDLFKSGIEPLAAGGRLGALLAQFPSSFHRSPEALEYIDWLLGEFRGYPMAVELRHRSWSDQRDAVRALLDRHRAAWVQIDQPRIESAIRQDLAPNDADFMYVRLHGRNKADWWQPEQSEDRYNYLYSETELQPIATKIAAARGLVKKVYLFLNNHFSAQSVANAATLRHMLDEPIGARMPAELEERYPELKGKVATIPPSRLL
jgi:uncharacterized protein YecE (DUF72 family)